MDLDNILGNFVPSKAIPLRLRKYLSKYTNLSNKEIKNKWENGLIEVKTPENINYTIFPDLEGLTSTVFPDEDKVFVDGKEILCVEPVRHYIAFYKPAGCECTLLGEIEEEYDSNTRKNNITKEETLDKWIEQLPQGVVPIGRLDKDVTGLLLFSNDHDLNHSVRKSGNTVVKEYHLTVSGDIDPNDTRIQRMLSGVELSDGPAQALRVDIIQSLEFPCKPKEKIIEKSIKRGKEYIPFKQKATVLSIDIKEGRKYIVKRLCKEAGFRLLHLHRERVGNISLNSMITDRTLTEPGEFRHLTPEEVEELWLMAGGKTSVDHNRIHAMYKLSHRYRDAGTLHPRVELFLEHILHNYWEQGGANPNDKT